jgi:hypothetical protein
VLQTTGESDENFPLLKGRISKEAKIYLCKNYVCLKPFNTVTEFVNALGNAQSSQP